jgi:tetratricopeptide (TPR) repeat protein
MSPQTAPSTGAATVPRRPKSRQVIWMALSAALVLAAAIYYWQTRPLPIQALSVQPFAAEGAPDPLAGAITEEIVDALGPITQQTADPMHRAVLEAGVTRSGGRVRVTARLVRGDGHRYWTRTVERPLVEIAREVAVTVVPGLRKKPARRVPAPAVYESFLDGRAAFLRNDFAKAADRFDAASQSDPDFARAFAWSAIARSHLAAQGAVRPNDLLPAARDAAERAVAIAPDTPEPHLALGIVRLQYDWDWDAARRELDRALELSPAQPLAVRWKQRWLEAMNRAPAAAIELPAVPRDADAARQFLAKADDLRAQAYVTPLRFALAAQAAHDEEALFFWLGVAYDERSVELPYLLRSPALPQSDPRLRELIQRLKLPTAP